MRQGLSTGRFWPALILLLFCLPLFVGLGRADLETDEAIYSYAVDHILETGDWLQPKSSPSETTVFLEKPPLKFWIVAAPIRAGLLPHNEFGLRFWDAVFGGAAFLYVFAIGVLLAGPICGAVAVLLLFVHWPLLLDHGLRTNNMEGALFLSYCGGVYHYFRWARSSAESNPPEAGAPTMFHALAVGVYFVLGFMTKFVAVAFLPFVLFTGSLLFRDYRRALRRGWRQWLGVGVMALALIAPWFIYAQMIFGRFLWETMLAQHVYTRFTSYLDPAHVHPWNYYFLNMYNRFADSGSHLLIIPGVFVLVVQSIRRRWAEGTIVLMWAIVPLGIISSGSSKIYHYVYPFLPPLALAGGYLAALFMMLAPAPLRRALEWIENAIARRWPGVSAAGTRTWAVRTAATIIVVAAVLAVVAVVYGQVRLASGQRVLFKSSGTLRPSLAIVIAAVLTRQSARITRFAVFVVLLGFLPIFDYKNAYAAMLNQRHPIRTVVDCVRRVEAARGGPPQGLYVDVQDDEMWHPIYYYFRQVRPWTRASVHAPDVAARYLNDPAQWRPMLLGAPVYRAVMQQRTHPPGQGAEATPSVSFPDSTFVGPGPYAGCSMEAARQQRR